MNKLVGFLGGVSIVIMSASCDLVKDFTYTVNPNPLELKGDSVKFSVSVNVPEKGLKKKVRAEITPKLGATSLGTWVVQGEKVTGNGTTISFKPGGVATFDMTVAYTSEMEAADLVLTGKVFKGKKEKSKEAIPDTKIADATIITQLLVNKSFKTLTIADNLKRSNEKTIEAKINFERGKSAIRPNEMKDKDVIEMVNWVKKNLSNPKITINSIEIKGYASPDGEEAKNDGLSMDRAEAGKKAIMEVFKKAKITVLSDPSKYSTAKFGEDFEGFAAQLAVTKSITESDKELFKRIINMNSDPAAREREMVNLGKSYVALEKNVFPAIRRSSIIVNYTEQGLTDDELKSAAASNPSTLTVEELLFTAEKLLTNVNDKVSLYASGVQTYSNDERVQNNHGVALYLNGKMNEAAASFQKAASIKSNDVTNNNLAAIAMSKGNRAEARKLMTQAKKGSSVLNTVSIAYNTAILDVLDGNYSAAVNGFTGNSFNKALAEVLTGKLDAAKSTLKQLTPDAMTHYLSAVIATRSGESVDAVVNHLKSAFASNPSLKEKASKDREFIKFMKDGTFTGAVN